MRDNKLEESVLVLTLGGRIADSLRIFLGVPPLTSTTVSLAAVLRAAWLHLGIPGPHPQEWWTSVRGLSEVREQCLLCCLVCPPCHLPGEALNAFSALGVLHPF